MAQVTAAVGAHHLGAHHPVAPVCLLRDGIVVCGLVERRPAAARVVLGVAREQLLAATGAAIRAGLERVVVLTGERTLRPLLAQNAILLGRELRAPLCVALLHLRHRFTVAMLA